MAPSRCHVYAVELDGGVIYVGSTCKTVRQRLAEHRESHPEARLRTDLCRSGRYFATRERAEEAERALAARLRRRGMTVWQG